MFDTEKFIREVEIRPALYNMSLKDYLNRKLKFKLWEDIANEMYKDWQNLSRMEKLSRVKGIQVKWKSIRDQFIKELKIQRNQDGNENRKKKYVYFDQLVFLKCHMGIRGSSLWNLQDNNRQTKEILSDIKTEEVTECSTCSNQSNSILISQKINNYVTDDDYSKFQKVNDAHFQKEDTETGYMGNKAFLMSLLPLINRFPEDMILEVRVRIMEAIQSCQDQENVQRSLPPIEFTTVVPTPAIIKCEESSIIQENENFE